VNGWNALLGLVGGVFTSPGFAIFTDLVYGWICAPGRRTITGMVAVADPTGRRRAHDAYHRLVRDGSWSLPSLWKYLTRHLMARFCPEGMIELACDDTLFHHDGAHVEGAGVFRDAVRSTVKKIVYARGLNLVVICLQIRPPWNGPMISVPVNVRIHRKHDKTTTVAHAQAMIAEIAGWLPDRSLHLVADGAYACLAGRDLPQCHLTSRMRRDASLFGPAPPPTGKPGRPRLKGDRLPTPERMSADLPDTAFTKVGVDIRGTKVIRLVHARDVLWYTVNHHDLVRLVIVRDPDGHQPDDYFATTDLDATTADVIERYADRWSIEMCFRDNKQNLGGQDPQTWKRRGPERAAALSLWLHSAIWCWYLRSDTVGTWTPRPWYSRKTTPSFRDALAALRRTLWRERITAMSGPHADNTEIADVVLDTLAHAA
jgi:hypothetical protein